MAITPQDIEQQTFSPSKQGYDTEEVDNFLEAICEGINEYLEKIADLKSRLTASDEALAAAQAQIAAYEEQAAAEPALTVAAPVADVDFSATERQISQALIVAQQSADKIVAEAETNAERIRSEADAKAREVIRQALAEKQNELDEIDRLRASRDEFRMEYKNLLQHFMDDADAVFPQQGIIAPNGSAAASATVRPVSAPAPVVSVPADVENDDIADTGDFGDLD